MLELCEGKLPIHDVNVNAYVQMLFWKMQEKQYYVDTIFADFGQY